MRTRVAIRRLANGVDLDLPGYRSGGAAGLDLSAALPVGSRLVIEPGARELVPTGIAIELETGYEGQVRPRSGLALRHGVTVLNAPGTIDADYRGEIGVILINHGSEPFEILRGDRIAQLVISRATNVTLVEVEALAPTERGAGGFGSTGSGGEEAR